MNDDIVIDEKQQVETHHIGIAGRFKIKFEAIKESWRMMSGGQKTLWVAVIVLGLVVVGGGIAGGIYIASDTNGAAPTGSNEPSASTTLGLQHPLTVTIADPEEPRNEPSPLTGELLTQTQYKRLTERLPLTVMVENHPDARPQTGLNKADLVFEALAEGGITRFNAVFLSQEPEVVGPVRSVRKYFLDLIAMLDDPLIMHIGGAQSTNPEADALGEIQKQGVKSLGVSGGKFWRVTDRLAPHNAYSNTKDLWNVANGYNWKGPASIHIWDFKEPGKDVNGTATSAERFQINWDSWGANSWSVLWQYDAEKNQYARSFLDGQHKDAISGEQLTARNVVVIYAPMMSAGDGSARIVYKTIGKGKATVFQDGKAVTGTYEKLTRKSSFNLKDKNGEAIKMNRGVSWVMLVPDTSEVVVQ